MARAKTVDAVIQEAVDGAVTRILGSIERYMAAAVAEQGKAAKPRRAGRKGAGAGRRRGRRAGDMTRWTADRRARRVPNFVIELTGLDTKKKIVAKFGENAAFAKGKPAPPAKAEAARGNGKTRAAG